MDAQEQLTLARQLADGSNVLDFEAALRIVEFEPAEAEKLLRERKERKRLQEERACARERRRRTLIEDFF
jgi:hypothetical protein